MELKMAGAHGSGDASHDGVRVPEEEQQQPSRNKRRRERMAEEEDEVKDKKKKKKVRQQEEPEPAVVEHPEEGETVSAPQVHIVDGRIVIDERSVVAPSTPAEAATTITTSDGGYNTGRSRFKRAPAERWSPGATLLFYKALEQFGTDFGLIQQQLFPGRTRRQVVAKYKNEDRLNPRRVGDALDHATRRHRVCLQDLCHDVRKDSPGVVEQGKGTRGDGACTKQSRPVFSDGDEGLVKEDEGRADGTDETVEAGLEESPGLLGAVGKEDHGKSAELPAEFSLFSYQVMSH